MARSRALPLLGLLSLLATLVVAPAGAQPSSDEVRGSISAAQARVQEIEMHASAVVEEFNTAQVEFEEITGQLEGTEERLGQLAAEVDDLSEAAAGHVRRLHKLGPTIELSSVFVAGDGAEIGARTAALRRILDGQRADFEGLDAARTELNASEQRLAQQREQAQQRRERVAEQRQQVEETLASYEEELGTLRTQLAEVEEEEAARERRRQQEAEAAAQAQAEAEAAEQEAEQEEIEQAATAEETSSTSSPTSTGPSNSGSGSGTSTDSSSSSNDSGPAPSTRQSASTAVDTALAQVGKPYQWGGSGPNSFDCSGLTSYAWRSAGVEITRTSRTQWDYTKRISRSELQPGDLVFYSRDGTRNGIGHVAMYIGGGDIVEAPYSGNNVRVRSDGLSRGDILGFGRV